MTTTFTCITPGCGRKFEQPLSRCRPCNAAYLQGCEEDHERRVMTALARLVRTWGD